jgi:hypothetical protein
MPLLIACWIVGAVILTLRAFRRGWFVIFGRILGSWLFAIGLLYGGAARAPATSGQPDRAQVQPGYPLRQP